MGGDYHHIPEDKNRVYIKDTITISNTDDKTIEINADYKDSKGWGLKIKDKDISFDVEGEDYTEISYDGSPFSIGRPSGDFPFPCIGLSHDNKEIELPGKKGRINSSEKLSDLPLTILMTGSLTREETVPVGDYNIPEGKTSFKVPDLEAEEPMFKVGGTLDHLLLSVIVGMRVKYAKKLTLKTVDLTMERKNDNILINVKQEVIIEIRPYVTCDILANKIKRIQGEIELTQRNAQGATKRFRKYNQEIEEEAAKQRKLKLLKHTLIGVSATVGVAGGVAVACWWNPGGWAAAALAAEKIAEINALTKAITSLTESIAVLGLSAITISGVSLNLLNKWNIEVPQIIPGMGDGIQKFKDLYKSKIKLREKLYDFISKVPHQLSTELELRATV